VEHPAGRRIQKQYRDLRIGCSRFLPMIHAASGRACGSLPR
jgi:hypothetical protein